MLPHVGPSAPQVGSKLVPSWPQVGPKLAHVGPSWPNLAQVGPKWAPRWLQVGSSWLMLAPSWPRDGPSFKVSPRLAKASTKALPPSRRVQQCLSKRFIQTFLLGVSFRWYLLAVSSFSCIARRHSSIYIYIYIHVYV